MTVRPPPDPVVAAFGRKSPLARSATSILCHALTESISTHPSGAAARLFDVWRHQFGLKAIADRRADDRRNRINGWWRKWLGLEAEIDADLFLFSAQSYDAITLKLIAGRLVGANIHGVDFERWKSLESGAAFRNHGIHNLVVGDVYQAAMHTRDLKMLSLLKQMATATNAAFDSCSLSTSLKSLYLDLFPREVRHALGEYYTPPLLVDHVLDVVGFDPADDRRVLDPMCGSGAFLSEILARRRKARQGTAAGYFDCVAGVELHPLAALTARVALLSLAADLPRSDSPMSIPIHLGDSILAAWNRRQAQTSSRLRIASPLGILEIADDSAAEQIIADELKKAGVYGDAAGMAADAKTLAALPPFDVIVGNPPWVGWESLSSEYRTATTPIWQAYGLFPHFGMETILGGGKKDLSMLATYTAADAWLKVGGKLGYVVTESAFKSVGAARGFRRFRIGDSAADGLKVVRVDDLTRLDPFSNAATRTTVLLLEKGNATTYPVPFIQWSKSGRRNAVAKPIDPEDPLSPWVAATPEVQGILHRMLGESDVRAYEGINTGGANGVYWLRVLESTNSGTVIVENDPSFGRSAAPTVRAEIESTYLYPLLRHQDVGRWRAEAKLSILMLQDPERRRGVDLHELERSAPNTLAFIRRFEGLLRKRAAYQRYFSAANGRSAPFYTMFNVGVYTLAQIKVVWRRMIAPIQAAVVAENGPKPSLPQETLCFIPCGNRDEASYYAALLNSRIVNVAAMATTQGSTKSFGAPHLIKLVRLPTFNPSNDAHRRLVAVAHSSEHRGDDLDRAAAAVYGFTDAERDALLKEYSFLIGERRSI